MWGVSTPVICRACWPVQTRAWATEYSITDLCMIELAANSIFGTKKNVSQLEKRSRRSDLHWKAELMSRYIRACSVIYSTTGLWSIIIILTHWYCIITCSKLLEIMQKVNFNRGDQNFISVWGSQGYTFAQINWLLQIINYFPPCFCLHTFSFLFLTCLGTLLFLFSLFSSLTACLWVFFNSKLCGSAKWGGTRELVTQWHYPRVKVLN